MSLVLAVLIGCTEDPEASPLLAASAESLDFGEVAVGLEAEQAFTLSNEGGGVVELLSIQLTDGEPSAWSVEREELSELGAGESMSVTVVLHPTEEGTIRGRIQVRSDDPTQSTHLVDLVGIGGESVIDGDGDGYTAAQGDCDDSRDDVYPGAEELCDGRDNDCSGSVDEGEADADGDGVRLCEDDCDDSNAEVYPGAPEICDDLDSDCDGVNADRTDTDGDGFTVCDGDCDDDERDSYPGNIEICDELDNDCSGDVDDIDEDADGHSICHPAGDCDDQDHTAYPVIVDGSWSGSESGTEAEPYNSLAEGLDNLDSVCRTVFLAEGEYELSIELDGDLSLMGASADSVVLSAPEGERHVDVGSGLTLALSSLTLSGGSPSGDGGSVRVVGGTLQAEDVVWSGNTATGDGGAVASSSGELWLQDCLFEDNLAEDDGGALAAVSSSGLDQGSVYSGNAGVRGGAVLVEGGELELSELRIEGNEASDVGGGVAVVGSDFRVLRSDLVLNSAASGGGGLALADVGSGLLANNVVQDNDGGSGGGGLHVTGSSSLQVYNNTVLANAGSGGLFSSSTELDVQANLFCFNEGYGASLGGSSASYNSAYGNTGASEFEDLSLVDGNDENNPLFVSFDDDRDPDNDDLSLSSGSPAIDSGSTDRADHDGSRNDRGHGGGPEAE